MKDIKNRGEMKMKRIMGFFLALVMSIGYLSLNSIVSYANDNASGNANEVVIPTGGGRDK